MKEQFEMVIADRLCRSKLSLKLDQVHTGTTPLN